MSSNPAVTTTTTGSHNYTTSALQCNNYVNTNFAKFSYRFLIGQICRLDKEVATQGPRSINIQNVLRACQGLRNTFVNSLGNSSPIVPTIRHTHQRRSEARTFHHSSITIVQPSAVNLERTASFAWLLAKSLLRCTTPRPGIDT